MLISDQDIIKALGAVALFSFGGIWWWVARWIGKTDDKMEKLDDKKQDKEVCNGRHPK